MKNFKRFKNQVKTITEDFLAESKIQIERWKNSEILNQEQYQEVLSLFNQYNDLMKIYKGQLKNIAEEDYEDDPQKQKEFLESFQFSNWFSKNALQGKELRFELIQRTIKQQLDRLQWYHANAPTEKSIRATKSASRDYVELNQEFPELKDKPYELLVPLDHIASGKIASAGYKGIQAKVCVAKFVHFDKYVASSRLVMYLITENEKYTLAISINNGKLIESKTSSNTEITDAGVINLIENLVSVFKNHLPELKKIHKIIRENNNLYQVAKNELRKTTSTQETNAVIRKHWKFKDSLLSTAIEDLSHYKSKKKIKQHLKSVDFKTISMSMIDKIKLLRDEIDFNEYIDGQMIVKNAELLHLFNSESFQLLLQKNNDMKTTLLNFAFVVDAECVQDEMRYAKEFMNAVKKPQMVLRSKTFIKMLKEHPSEFPNNYEGVLDGDQIINSSIAEQGLKNVLTVFDVDTAIEKFVSKPAQQNILWYWLYRVDGSETLIPVNTVKKFLKKNGVKSIEDCDERIKKFIIHQYLPHHPEFKDVEKQFSGISTDMFMRFKKPFINGVREYVFKTMSDFKEMSEQIDDKIEKYIQAFQMCNFDEDAEFPEDLEFIQEYISEMSEFVQEYEDENITNLDIKAGQEEFPEPIFQQFRRDFDMEDVFEQLEWDETTQKDFIALMEASEQYQHSTPYTEIEHDMIWDVGEDIVDWFQSSEEFEKMIENIDIDIDNLKDIAIQYLQNSEVLYEIASILDMNFVEITLDGIYDMFNDEFNEQID